MNFKKKDFVQNCKTSILARMMISPRAFWKCLVRRAKFSTEDQANFNDYRDWFDGAIRVPVTNPKKVFLVASFMPLTYCIKLESIIAHAMSQKGFKIVVVTNTTCERLVTEYHKNVNGFEVFVLDNYLSVFSFFRLKKVLKNIFSIQTDLIPRIKALRYRGAFIGLHSLATLSAGNDVDLTAISAWSMFKLKRTIWRSIFMVDASLRFIQHISPSLVFSVEKGFVGTAELFYAAINNNIQYVQWTSCHEPNSIMLKRFNLQNFREHPFSISNTNWENIKQQDWTEDYARKILRQFHKGYTEGQWFQYKNLTFNQREATRTALLQELKLDPKKKTAIIYSHILNDANLFYGKDLFDGGYEEWLVETIRVAALNESVNWVLKLHPANMYRSPKLAYSRRYCELKALERAFGCIPAFLTVIYPDNVIKPLSFFGITDYGITVRGTVGMELPCFGIPTLTAGTGRYSGKGFTIDSSCRKDYLSKIRHIHEIPPLTLEQVQLGQRYAYNVFNIRPARYSEAFSDTYNPPDGYSRRRDLSFNGRTVSEIVGHWQVQKIVSFLCSEDEDYFDSSYE